MGDGTALKEALQGLTKKEAIEISRKKEVWSAKELRAIVGGLKGGIYLGKPTGVRIGDVFRNGLSSHPCLVLAKTGFGYMCCVLTSNKEYPNNIEKCKSRFFNGSYITNSIVHCTEEEILANFMGVLENASQLNRIKKKIKEQINELL